MTDSDGDPLVPGNQCQCEPIDTEAVGAMVRELRKLTEMVNLVQARETDLSLRNNLAVMIHNLANEAQQMAQLVRLANSPAILVKIQQQTPPPA